MELLERQEALTRMRRLLGAGGDRCGCHAADRRRGGIGKTVLVQRFVREVDRSARVLIGACGALSTPRPLGPLHDIAESAGGELPRPRSKRSRTALRSSAPC